MDTLSESHNTGADSGVGGSQKLCLSGKALSPHREIKGRRFWSLVEGVCGTCAGMLGRASPHGFSLHDCDTLLLSSCSVPAIPCMW